MANNRFTRTQGGLLNVTLTAICGGDRALHHLEPVHRTLVAGKAFGMAHSVRAGMDEVETIQKVARRENQRLTDDDLLAVADVYDTDRNGTMNEMTRQDFVKAVRVALAGKDEAA